MSGTSMTQAFDDSGRQRLLESVIADYIRACDAGAAPDRDGILKQHPELADDLRGFFAQRDQLNQLAAPMREFGDSLAAHIGPGKHISYVGDYELLEEIARGGMGVVYKAKQKTLGRLVAVKMMLTGRLANEEDVKRFQIEAQAAANLQHPNIVPIHEVGQHEGLHYFSMDYIEGRSLASLLRENVLPPKGAANIVRQIAEAIHYAHQQGTLHRDLKPSNVLMARSGRIHAAEAGTRPDESGHYEPRITDFGLAMRVEGDSGLTQTGQIVGTPSYMPPEQAQGKRSLIGPGSDVYSLGAILYECLTGRAPFRADSVMKTIEQVIHREAASPRLLNSGVPRDLETICLKCLEKEPHRRYGTAQLLADDLGRFLRDEPIVARPTTLWERSAKWVRRHPTAAALVFVSAVAMLALVGVGVGRHYNARLETANASLKSVNSRLETTNTRLETTSAKLQTTLQAVQVEKAEAERQRTLAKEAEAKAQRYLYASQMILADRAKQEGNIGRVMQLLRSVIPQSPDQEDLRGFEWHHLWRQYNGEQSRLRGHKGAVTAIAFSPNDRLLASASADKTVKLWDTITGKELRTLEGHTARVTSVAFSPDSKQLISGGADKNVVLWETATGKQRHRLEGHQGTVTSVAFRPDGQRFATASEDKTVRIWNSDGMMTLEFKQHTHAVYAVAFSPAGNTLASVSNGGTEANPEGEFILWNPSNGDVRFRRDGRDPNDQQAPRSGWNSVAFSLDGKLIATGGVRLRRETGAVTQHLTEIWDTATKNVLTQFDGHRHAITQVAFNSDRKRVVSSSIDQTIKVWDVVQKKELVTFPEEASALTATFSPDGLRVVSGSEDHTIKIWSPPRNEPRALIEGGGRLNNVAFSPDGMRVAAVRPPVAYVCDLATGEKLLGNFTRVSNFGRVAWSPDSGSIAVGRTVLDLATTKSVSLPFEELPNGGSCEGAGTAFSKDGKRIAAVVSLDRVGIWETASQRCLHVLRDVPARTYCLAFSPDGRLLAVGGSIHRAPYTGIIQFWSVENGTMSAVLDGYRNTAVSVCFDSDGKRIAAAFCVTQPGQPEVATNPSELRVWDVATMQEIFNLRGHHSRVFSVAFSPDGKRLASSGGPWMQYFPSKDENLGEVRIWDTTTGQEIATLDGHRATVFGVAFSPCGRRLATASGDGKVRIFDGSPVIGQPLIQ